MLIYHLVTKWSFQAPMERVWQEIIDIGSWPTWWRSFKRATIRGPEPKLRLGSVADCEVRGAMPYTLRFTVEATVLQPPSLMELKSAGDLAGGGKWVLELRNDGTACTFYWDVGMTRWVFDLLGRLPFVRAMLERNHDKVMAEGYRLLKRRVEGG